MIIIKIAAKVNEILQGWRLIFIDMADNPKSPCKGNAWNVKIAQFACSNFMVGNPF